MAIEDEENETLLLEPSEIIALLLRSTPGQSISVPKEVYTTNSQGGIFLTWDDDDNLVVSLLETTDEDEANSE